VGFIDYELSLTKKNFKPLSHYCRIFDTLSYARQLHVGQRNSLDALCKRYGVDNTQRELHGALLDAHLLAQVYLSMTGGQSSLFDQLYVPESNAAISSNIAVSDQHHALIVQKASSEE